MSRRELVIAIFLLLIHVFVRESLGAPVALSKHPRTVAGDEGALTSHLQDPDESKNQVPYSEHHTQHQSAQPGTYHRGDTDVPTNGPSPKAPNDERGQTHVAGREIKNFPPVSSGEAVSVSLSTADQMDRQHQQRAHIFPERMIAENSVQKDIKEHTASDGSVDPGRRSADQNADLKRQINDRVKAVMKNADKSKRLSFFSVLHPALAAALSPEKSEEKADIPRPPLSTIDYSSGPLKGTESRDQEALRFPAVVQSKQSVLAEMQEKAAELRESEGFEQKEHQFDAQDSQARINEIGEKFGEEGKALGLVRRDEFQHPAQNYQREKASTGGGIDLNAKEKESQDGEVDETISSPRAHKGITRLESDKASDNGNTESANIYSSPAHSTNNLTSVLNSTEADEPSRTGKVLKTTAKYWHGFVNQVKRVVGAFRSAKPASSETTKNQQTDNFSEDDVQDMVNEVVREIQTRTDGRKQLDLAGGSVAKDGNGEHVTHETGKGPLLMLRTKTVVSADVVADAVTSTAKKMLSVKGDSISHETSSRLLREVQDKLEELLQPID